ncbi:MULTISPECIES: DUF2273 domain-containing protein [Desulfofundulus]|jgi:uncharacterized membrane protein|nr:MULTISPECIES: DUF2273 domain-containing protein [Desulfofundulus]MBE3584692.1 DUF2273 domain-containing protein [Thermoanaerobacter sp.]MCS5694788.1 DUF2273 domain-containing protein [Desulfofundulus thermocisternus]
MDAYALVELWRKHKGKITGIILGLAFGWFAITYGLLKAVFVSACVVAGYYIGKHLDERVNFKEIFSRLFQER